MNDFIIYYCIVSLFFFLRIPVLFNQIFIIIISKKSNDYHKTNVVLKKGLLTRMEIGLKGVFEICNRPSK